MPSPTCLDANAASPAHWKRVSCSHKLVYAALMRRLRNAGSASSSTPPGAIHELPFDSEHSTMFSARPDAHLYDVGQRMDFVSRAAQFDGLLRTQLSAVEAALREIAAAGAETSVRFS